MLIIVIASAVLEYFHRHECETDVGNPFDHIRYMDAMTGIDPIFNFFGTMTIFIVMSHILTDFSAKSQPNTKAPILV